MGEANISNHSLGLNSLFWLYDAHVSFFKILSRLNFGGMLLLDQESELRYDSRLEVGENSLTSTHDGFLYHLIQEGHLKPILKGFGRREGIV